MNQLDLAFLALLVPAAIGGYQLGLLARVLSWLGLAIGLYGGIRVAPGLLRMIDAPTASNRFLVVTVTLLAAGLLGQAAGLGVGNALRKGIRWPALKNGDRYAGAVAGSLGLVVLFWLMLPLMADVPGWPARLARNSALGRRLDSSLPSAPNTLQSLRGLIGDDDFPQVFETLRPSPNVGSPPSLNLPPAVQTRVLASSVKVEVRACQQLQEGSGFVAGDRLVATNAHVVAGAEDISVQRSDGVSLDARLVGFDPDRDLAFLQVPSINRPPLPTADGRVGSTGAVFGHPGGQDPVRIAPARVEENIRANGRDLYDARSTVRDVFVLAAELRRGDSGGPFVDVQGRVIGVAFAIAPDKPGTSYALTSDELRESLQRPRRLGTSPGPCLAE